MEWAFMTLTVEKPLWSDVTLTHPLGVMLSEAPLKPLTGPRRASCLSFLVCRAQLREAARAHLATHLDNAGPPAAVQRLRTASSRSPGSALCFRRA
jgi:hypothetical protein